MEGSNKQESLWQEKVACALPLSYAPIDLFFFLLKNPKFAAFLRIVHAWICANSSLVAKPAALVPIMPDAFE